MKQGVTNLGNSIFPEITFLADFSQPWRQLARNQQFCFLKSITLRRCFYSDSQHKQGPSSPSLPVSLVSHPHTVLPSETAGSLWHAAGMPQSQV